MAEAKTIKPGDTLPDAELIEKQSEKVRIRDLFKGKTGVLLGMPGAFTPGCTQTHLPGYVDRIEEIKAAGAEEVACVCVNDPWVMSAWAKQMGTEGKVRMLADPRCEFCNALGCVQDDTATLGSMRSRRFSMVIQDNVVKFVNVEQPGPKELSVSLVDNALTQLQQLKGGQA